MLVPVFCSSIGKFFKLPYRRTKNAPLRIALIVVALQL